MHHHERIREYNGTNSPVAMEMAKIDAGDKEKDHVNVANFQTVKVTRRIVRYFKCW